MEECISWHFHAIIVADLSTGGVWAQGVWASWKGVRDESGLRVLEKEARHGLAELREVMRMHRLIRIPYFLAIPLLFMAQPNVSAGTLSGGASWASASDRSASVLYHEGFSAGPAGWKLGPPNHVPYFAMSLDTMSFGVEPPSLRVDVPLHTFNYRLQSPWIALPTLDQDYTFQVSLRVDQPASPFRVDLIIYDEKGNWIDRITEVDLSGQSMGHLRTFRFSFHPSRTLSTPGGCALQLGMPYQKLLHEGSFWIDDIELRQGREAQGLDLYLTPTSIEAGDDVDAHISAGGGQVALRVFRMGVSREPVADEIRVAGLMEQPVPPEVWSAGCGWPAATTLRTDTAWAPGVYIVEADDGDRIVWAPFVVRGRGGEGRVLIVLPTHTDQAYNAWGGRSFYSKVTTVDVSFDRPTPSSLYSAPIHLIRMFSREDIGFDVATDDDLNDRPELLFRYPGVILTWHSEYWTRRMREGVEAYIDAGGSVLSFSGNTCWWQTRIEGEGRGRRLVCYKDMARHDEYQWIDPAMVTTRWDEAPVKDSPARFLGLSWRYGGLVNWTTTCPCPYDWTLGHGGYRVYRTNHWAFEGTGLVDGDTLGRGATIVGYEVDGAPVEWIDGLPGVQPESETPPEFRVLGAAPSWSSYSADSIGVALMGIMERPDGSFVFNGGTTGWCWGLARDPAVLQITRNLIRHLPSSAPAEMPLPRLMMEAYPNPSNHGVTLEVRGDIPPKTRIHIYDLAGRVLISRPAHRRIYWGFLDSQWHRIPSGVYLARMPGADAVKIVLTR